MPQKINPTLDAIFAADLPMLFSSKHGIGKSEFLEHYARERKLGPYILDLSLLEATDLTGLPYRASGEKARGHTLRAARHPAVPGRTPSILAASATRSTTDKFPILLK